MKNKILIVTALFFSAYFLQSCTNSTNNTAKIDGDSPMTNMAQNDSMGSGNMKMDNGMMQSMGGMMGKMNDMKMTGDLDLDFANMMMMHHQGAIDMCEMEIAKGADTQIKAMAQTIITTQKAEIEKMQQFAKNYKMPKTKMGNEEMHNDLDATMKTMMNKMNTMQMTGNTDKDFVMMMIPHHESAITMAEDEVKYGKQPELKKMAQQMISDQGKEVTIFKTWLSGQK